VGLLKLDGKNKEFDFLTVDGKEHLILFNFFVFLLNIFN